MDEALIKRVPPHSIEAEQSVVGAILMDRDAITVAAEIVCGDDFYQKAYGVIFDSVVELFNEGKPVDLITLQNRLREKAVPEEISSLEFVRDLVTAVPTSANVKYYAEIVSEKATLRRLIKMNEAIADECYQGQEPLEAILERTEKQVFELVQNRGGNGEYVPIKQVVLNALEKIEKASKSKGTVTGIPTGFIDLDYESRNCLGLVTLICSCINGCFAVRSFTYGSRAVRVIGPFFFNVFLTLEIPLELSILARSIPCLIVRHNPHP